MTELIIIKTSNSQPIKKLLQEKNINYEIYNETEQEEIHKKKWLADYEAQANDPIENQEIEEWEHLETEGWDD